LLHDADDRELILAERNLRPDWVRTWEESAREHRVDDRFVHCGLGRWLKSLAGNQPHAHDLKILAGHQTHEHRLGSCRDGKTAQRRVKGAGAAGRQHVGRGDSLDQGAGVESRQHVLIQRTGGRQIRL